MIIAVIKAAIAFLTGIAMKIYIDNKTEQLMMRDNESFQMYWNLSRCGEDAIEYKVGLRFEPQANSLMVFDEASIFIFIGAEKLTSSIDSHLCICLTTTHDDTLKYTGCSHVTNPPSSRKSSLMVMKLLLRRCPEIRPIIVKLLPNESVLAFCENNFAKQLISLTKLLKARIR